MLKLSAIWLILAVIFSPLTKASCTNCQPVTPFKSLANYNPDIYYSSAFYASDNLRSELNRIIKTDIHLLTYSQVYTVLTYSDEDSANPNNIVTLYKNSSVAKTFNNTVGNNDPDSWNREHVWPKSHGFPESSQAGYTDVHAIRAADRSMNTLRSNLDFGDAQSPVEEAPDNRYSPTSWEPRDEIKGDVARMMFYMDVRYEGDETMPDLQLVDEQQTDSSTLADGVGKLGKLCTLYQWHRQDPVDASEQKRNDIVYQYQGNRNPFIDYPDWVAQLYGPECGDDAPVQSPKAGSSGGSLPLSLILLGILLVVVRPRFTTKVSGMPCLCDMGK